MCFSGTTGKHFQMSGLEDILIEREVIAAGSMKGVMTRHMYNRSVRAHISASMKLSLGFSLHIS